MGPFRSPNRPHPEAAPADRRFLPAILLLALAVRLYGLNWGLPNVYEEATPLRQAWDMWGWGPDRAFDPNPHFFNYPSLTIYLQFLAQAALFGVLFLTGTTRSALDFQVLYATDPTAFLLAGRTISLLFGCATVYLVYRLGVRAAGERAGLIAAAVMAVNPFYVTRSQMIEVDVPLTFFTALALLLLLRAWDRPGGKSFAMGGAAIGLAAASKYTGATLLAPLVVGFLIARYARREEAPGEKAAAGARPAWTHLGIGLAVAAAAFFLASPFVVLDVSAFARDFSLERRHMALGHFGADAGPTWLYYLRILLDRLAGWPIAALGVAGMVWYAGVRRAGWAMQLAGYAALYVAVIASWTMKVDRYLLPMLPILAVFAGTTAGSLYARLRVRAPRPGRLVPVLAAVVVGLPIPAIRSHWERFHADSRSEAGAWMEANISEGSLIAMEPNGPELFGPQRLWPLDAPVRERILEGGSGRRLFGVLPVPMFQAESELSDVFYDLALYREVDYFVTTSAVRDRYEREPERFVRQTAFYADLEANFPRETRFDPRRGSGPSITVYRNPAHAEPFARRAPQIPPAPLRPATGFLYLGAGTFHYHLGMNYECFGYDEAALSAYRLALTYPTRTPDLYWSLCAGTFRCLLRLGRTDEALRFVQGAEDRAPSDRDRALLRTLRLRAFPDGGAAPPPSGVHPDDQAVLDYPLRQ